MILGRLPHEIDDLDPDHLASLGEHLPDAWNQIHGTGKSRSRRGSDDGEPRRAVVTDRYVEPENDHGPEPSPGMIAMVRAGGKFQVSNAEQMKSLARAIRIVEREKADART